MLPANLLNTIKAHALGQKPLVTVTAEATPKTGSFEPGQKLQGSVRAQVSPGMFKVIIADQLIQMQLPASVKSGDTIALQVIATQPRLVFSMSASTNPLSTPEQLSSASRLLSALSQQPPEKAYVRTAQRTPLWVAPQAPDSMQLAGLLREVLSNSGLFYESHQAQWLRGARSTAQLLHEPQNLPPEQVRVANNLSGTSAPGAESSLLRKDSGQASTVPGAAHISTPGIPEHLQPLVQQQLNALETRQMLWQGNIWPGQAMEWEIHEQAAQTPEADGQRQWFTRLRLNLPRLGEVTAMLRFDSAGLSLTLVAAATDTRMALGNAGAQLVATLSGSGIPVANILVAQHDAAG